MYISPGTSSLPRGFLQSLPVGMRFLVELEERPRNPGNGSKMGMSSRSALKLEKYSSGFRWGRDDAARDGYTY